ncbi:MAG TPA: S49 family peptidase [Amaricoccus sp.]|mgnify:CR=1 FL=1|jgi:ClpP class serine protease|uniref:S49 family peptidase n=1 Tax=Amaricoccus sp. TaxID=1872485 RepID=UPI002C102C85|nr:S49 family peptidase [Amaricoccus sp.]HRO13085.1 S49 family peptidase [Amaricoccus sp.]
MTSSLLARLAGRPLALAPFALDGLLALTPEARSPLLRIGSGDRDRAGYAVTDDGIAVVPVLGPLLTRGDWLTSLLGATDYGTLGRTLEAAFTDSSARAVVLELDSPGGEVGGLFDLVDRIGALRESSGRPLWAVAGEAALSAAYAIASAADRLYVTRTAEIGSIGIVAAHVDASGADAMAGRKWTLVHAGARKADGNSHEPLSDRAFAAIQADVDALHGELVALVARNRRMPPESVRGSEAAIWRGPRGIAAGFADRLGTLDQALADLATSLDPPPGRTARLTPTRPLQGTSMTDQTTTASTETPAVTDPPAGPAASEAPAAPTPADTAAAAARAVTTAATVAASPTVPAAPATPALAEPAAAAAAARLRAEYAEIASVAAQAGRLGVDIDAADAMARGVPADALRRSVLEALAARSEAAAVVSAAPAPAAAPGAESPIVRRARERAAAPRS